MTDRQAWLEQRRTGIGGSDIAAIAGVHPYKSAWSVYHDKVGNLPDYDSGEAAEWGHALEELIAYRWHDRHGPDGTFLEHGHWRRHRQHEWWVGTPDFTITDQAWAPTEDALAVVEVKNVGYLAWLHHWSNGGTIPPWVELQCNWYAELVDVDLVHLAVLVNGQRLADPLEVPRNPQRIEKLARIGERFWHDHVVARVPPDPDGSARAREELDLMYPILDGTRAVDLPEEMKDVTVEYVRWREVEQKAATHRAAAGQKLIDTLGRAGATDGFLPGDDKPSVTYRPVRTVDYEALRVDWPDVLDQCRKPPAYSNTEIRKMLGAHTYAKYQVPSDTRRLYVRDHTTTEED